MLRTVFVLAGLACQCFRIDAFQIGMTGSNGIVPKNIAEMKPNNFGNDLAVVRADRRLALTEFVKFASLSFMVTHSLPAHAKRARGGSDINKDTVPETREEREARIKKERAEYEERRKLAEVGSFVGRVRHFECQ
jgi:hypothetical protein